MQRGDRVGGRFEIVDRVASGGMGTIFLGRDVRSRREVAVKVVSVETADEAARFAREAQILAGFADPGVVGYIAHGSDYLVMEWVEGESLRQRLDRAPLPGAVTVTVARQLARALAALHAAGIVHRDVKPANLMLAGECVKLVDFGIARSAMTPRVTLTGMHVGTAGYMAPEQARGEPEVSGAADVFALGCVLYECLAGEPAFCGDSVMALRAKVLLHDPPPLRVLVPALPEALEALVMRLLSRDIARRPAASDAIVALEAIDMRSAPAVAARRAEEVPTEPARRAEIAPTEVALGPGGVTHAMPAAAEDARAVERVPALRGMTYAVLVAIEDGRAIERVPGVADGTAQCFEGGAVMTRPDAASAARLALEVAAQLPDAWIAIAGGRSPGEAIDRSARLVEQLGVASVAGERVAGAWIDAAAVCALEGAFAVEAHGDRVRLRGVA